MSAGYWLLWILYKALQLYTYAILASAILSWGFLPPTNKVVQFLRFITEPVVGPCRQLLNRFLPASWRMFDFSPVLALLAVQVVSRLLILVMGMT